jgi:hypothetical protein
VFSQLGNLELNFTKNVHRRPLNHKGWRNDELKSVQSHTGDGPSILMHDPSVTQSLEELHENGKDVVSLDDETLFYAIDEKEYVFVKYFADWCRYVVVVVWRGERGTCVFCFVVCGCVVFSHFVFRFVKVTVEFLPQVSFMCF